ncbi:DNA polymerase subunit beta [filamentous cyanobacterium CCP5]|nr:DNA polymerase subunit beta [filamentous cyanobacterium CCP5]
MQGNLPQKLTDNRQKILQLAEKHGAFNVRVFGSVVRGEVTEESDIDFLVDYDLDKITPWFPGSLISDLSDLLGCEIDVVPASAIHAFIRDRVLEEAVPL